MKKNSSSRKKIFQPKDDSVHKQNSLKNTGSPPSQNIPCRTAKKSLRLDRIVYSFAAVLIFLSGIYFGTKYLPAVVEDNYTFSHKPTSPIKKEKNLYKRSTTSSFYDPEDFFPAAEFRKQAAILLGCQNNLNKMPELYV